NNPDLEKMDEFACRMVVFAVGDAGPRGDPLHVTGAHHGLRAHAVLVLQRATDHLTDNFKVAMGVRPEAFPSLDPVLVNNAQSAKTHMLRVVVVGKRKRMVAIQPTVIRVS